MHTQLASFCPQFDGLVRPVLPAVDLACTALEQCQHGTPGKELRSLFADLSHHLRVLCDKVKSQQAYVLIFGPLKSGKSTLMNAIAGTWVSEVSSLPAYPCLVFVRGGGAHEYVATRYDGKVQTFSDAPALQRHIEQAHGALAAAIRDAEQRGTPFDPQEHFPQAIRRVDVVVPSQELATTGAVLVDTPGLYTRMRFGYDRMTRDFRDAAACAIFVVKSDTLFLEQVFAEFQQLLDLFSRIFLVVNVDAQKRDVTPDGRLVPSLEQSRPEAVLTAFEELAMPQPLQQAANDGRLRLYPVDLLHAASAQLQRGGKEQAPESFAAFQRDFQDYLASADYTAAFLRDALQRAHTLLAELASALGSAPLRRLQARVQQLDEEQRFVQQQQDAIGRALAADLAPAFARAEGVLQQELERSARDDGQKLLRTLGASIDTWFLSSHSLHWLIAGQWTPMLHDHRLDVERAGRRAVEQSLQAAGAGLDLPDEVDELCRRHGVELSAVRQAALAGLGALPADPALRVPVDVAAVPVRRGALDLLALRSRDKVRQRVFGDAAQPDTKIPGRDKAARLGEPGRLHLHQCVTQFRARLAPATVQALRKHLGERLRAATIAALQGKLRALQPELQQRADAVRQERSRLAAVLAPLQSVEGIVGQVQQLLPALAQRFAALVPGAPKDVVLTPQPRAQPREAAGAPEPREPRR
jgi:hypothetical protein